MDIRQFTNFIRPNYCIGRSEIPKVFETRGMKYQCVGFFQIVAQD